MSANLTVVQLKERLTELGVPFSSSLRKAALVTLLDETLVNLDSSKSPPENVTTRSTRGEDSLPLQKPSVLRSSTRSRPNSSVRPIPTPVFSSSESSDEVITKINKNSKTAPRPTPPTRLTAKRQQRRSRPPSTSDSSSSEEELSNPPKNFYNRRPTPTHHIRRDENVIQKEIQNQRRLDAEGSSSDDPFQAMERRRSFQRSQNHIKLPLNLKSTVKSPPKVARVGNMGVHPTKNAQSRVSLHRNVSPTRDPLSSDSEGSSKVKHLPSRYSTKLDISTTEDNGDNTSNIPVPRSSVHTSRDSIPLPSTMLKLQNSSRRSPSFGPVGRAASTVRLSQFGPSSSRTAPIHALNQAKNTTALLTKVQRRPLSESKDISDEDDELYSDNENSSSNLEEDVWDSNLFSEDDISITSRRKKTVESDANKKKKNDILSPPAPHNRPNPFQRSSRELSFSDSESVEDSFQPLAITVDTQPKNSQKRKDALLESDWESDGPVSAVPPKAPHLSDLSAPPRSSTKFAFEDNSPPVGRTSHKPKHQWINRVSGSSRPSHHLNRERDRGYVSQTEAVADAIAQEDLDRNQSDQNYQRSWFDTFTSFLPTSTTLSHTQVQYPPSAPIQSHHDPLDTSRASLAFYDNDNDPHTPPHNSNLSFLDNSLDSSPHEPRLNYNFNQHSQEEPSALETSFYHPVGSVNKPRPLRVNPDRFTLGENSNSNSCTPTLLHTSYQSSLLPSSNPAPYALALQKQFDSPSSHLPAHSHHPPTPKDSGFYNINTDDEYEYVDDIHPGQNNDNFVPPFAFRPKPISTISSKQQRDASHSEFKEDEAKDMYPTQNANTLDYDEEYNNYIAQFQPQEQKDYINTTSNVENAMKSGLWNTLLRFKHTIIDHLTPQQIKMIIFAVFLIILGSVTLISVLNTPYYQVNYFIDSNGLGDKTVDSDLNLNTMTGTASTPILSQLAEKHYNFYHIANGWCNSNYSPPTLHYDLLADIISISKNNNNNSNELYSVNLFDINQVYMFLNSNDRHTPHNDTPITSNCTPCPSLAFCYNNKMYCPAPYQSSLTPTTPANISPSQAQPQQIASWMPSFLSSSSNVPQKPLTVAELKQFNAQLSDEAYLALLSTLPYPPSQESNHYCSDYIVTNILTAHIQHHASIFDCYSLHPSLVAEFVKVLDNISDFFSVSLSHHGLYTALCTRDNFIGFAPFTCHNTAKSNGSSSTSALTTTAPATNSNSSIDNKFVNFLITILDIFTRIVNNVFIKPTIFVIRLLLSILFPISINQSPEANNYLPKLPQFASKTHCGQMVNNIPTFRDLTTVDLIDFTKCQFNIPYDFATHIVTDFNLNLIKLDDNSSYFLQPVPYQLLLNTADLVASHISNFTSSSLMTKSPNNLLGSLDYIYALLNQFYSFNHPANTITPSTQSLDPTMSPTSTPIPTSTTTMLNLIKYYAISPEQPLSCIMRSIFLHPLALILYALLLTWGIRVYYNNMTWYYKTQYNKNKIYLYESIKDLLIRSRTLSMFNPNLHTPAEREEFSKLPIVEFEQSYIQDLNQRIVASSLPSISGGILSLFAPTITHNPTSNNDYSFNQNIQTVYWLMKEHDENILNGNFTTHHANNIKKKQQQQEKELQMANATQFDVKEFQNAGFFYTGDNDEAQGAKGDDVIPPSTTSFTFVQKIQAFFARVISPFAYIASFFTSKPQPSKHGKNQKDEPASGIFMSVVMFFYTNFLKNVAIKLYTYFFKYPPQYIIDEYKLKYTEPSLAFSLWNDVYYMIGRDSRIVQVERSDGKQCWAWSSGIPDHYLQLFSELGLDQQQYDELQAKQQQKQQQLPQQPRSSKAPAQHQPKTIRKSTVMRTVSGFSKQQQLSRPEQLQKPSSQEITQPVRSGIPNPPPTPSSSTSQKPMTVAPVTFPKPKQNLLQNSLIQNIWENVNHQPNSLHRR